MKLFNKELVRPRMVCIAFLLVLSFTLFFRHSQGFGKVPQDFGIFLKAVDRVENGTNPYVFEERTPYKYSPGALVFLELLPKDPERAWVIFKLFCCISWIASILLGYSFKTWSDLLALVAGVALSWKGLLETLDYGQMEFFLMFVTLLSARWAEKRRFLSSFLLGALPVLKAPWAFFVVPFFFLAWRASKSEVAKYVSGFLAGTFVMGVVIPTLRFGWSEMRVLSLSWLQIMKVQPMGQVYLDDHNQSIWSTALRWIQFQGGAGVGLGILLFLVCFFLVSRLTFRFATRKNSEQPLEWIAPWWIAGELLNPVAWRWGSLLLVGTPFSIRRATTGSQTLVLYLHSIGVLILLLLQQNPVVKWIGFKHWTELHSFGLITLYWLLILSLTQVNKRNALA